MKYLILLSAMCFLNLISCRPKLAADAPGLLRFDQEPTENLNRLHKLSQVQGVRLFWWNVAWGSFNSSGDVDHNLIELASSNARPDIMILGEYKETVLSTETKQELAYHYPHRYFTPYTAGDDVGIQVFSIRPLKRSGRINLPWYPIQFTDIENKRIYLETWDRMAASEVKFWDRSVELLTFTHAGQTFTLAPVHLLEPWAALFAAKGTAETVKNFFNGNKNPLINQIHHLRKVIMDRTGSFSNVLMIGDFNIPKSLFGLSPNIYNVLSKNFIEGHFGNPNTFPAISALDRVHGFFKKVSVKIDHALLGDNLERIGGAAVHIKGSDHYAIYVVVAPKKTSWWGLF